MEKKKETPSPADTEVILRNRVMKAYLALCRSVSGSPETVFDNLLRFIIHGFHVGGAPMKDWPYAPERSADFMAFLKVWTASLAEIFALRPWYDFLGYIYEMSVAGPRRKSGNGQFFTPVHVCDMMAAIAGGKNEGEETACDPCCGSGRLLLARHADNPGAILYANDLDRTCVMMTICNFIVHGCKGVVTWGDSLKNTVNETWLVNPAINDPASPLFGCPHCIRSDEAA